MKFKQVKRTESFWITIFFKKQSLFFSVIKINLEMTTRSILKLYLVIDFSIKTKATYLSSPNLKAILLILELCGVTRKKYFSILISDQCAIESNPSWI